MTRPPDFDELVGGDDLTSSERERLRRVHELLVAAGPPPDFVPSAPPGPSEATVIRLSSRRKLAVVALAAAFVIAAFGAGYFVGKPGGGGGAEEVVALAGTGQAAKATGSLYLFATDAAGNWPMKLEVKGLTPRHGGRSYELWLTKHGRLAALCGSFLAKPDGTADVRLNAPYRLGEYDSWVVVATGSKTPLLTTT
jgi:hypothetical protein